MLKEDELQVGSHVCFGDITQDELDFIATCLESNDGIPHEELKAFIEAQDMQLTDGKPTGLAGCLVAMRLENFQTACSETASSVEQLMRPRTWRHLETSVGRWRASWKCGWSECECSGECSRECSRDKSRRRSAQRGSQGEKGKEGKEGEKRREGEEGKEGEEGQEVVCSLCSSI